MSVAAKDAEDGECEDFEVEREAAMVDVPDVEFEFLFPGECVASVDLGPAGESWFHFVAAHLLLGIAREVFGKERARSDDAHVAFEDVPELREFVEAGGAEETAKFGEALVIWEEVALGVALVRHGAEFVEGEGLAMESGAGLAKEDGLAQDKENNNGDQSINREEEHKNSNTSCNTH